MLNLFKIFQKILKIIVIKRLDFIKFEAHVKEFAILHCLKFCRNLDGPTKFPKFFTSWKIGKLINGSAITIKHPTSRL